MMSEREQALDYCFQSQPQLATPIRKGARRIAEATGLKHHDLLVVLGSGLLEAVAGLGTVRAQMPLADLGTVPVPTAQGHGHELLSIDVPISTKLPETGQSEVSVKHVLVSTGRSHLYEGWNPAEVCQMVRIAAMTGIEAAFLTNAGGALREWELGDVMAITDHINQTGESPFIGPAFTDIFRMWDPILTTALRMHTQREGVYAILRGPEYQTRAESLMLRDLGVDMVGMSTIMEAIALHQLGVRVCGVSITSDLSFSDTATVHEDVIRAVVSAYPNVQNCILSVLGALDS